MEDSNVDWPGFLHVLWYVIVFGYGAIVGSFLNVVIYRMPLGKSLTNPPSKCPNCNYALGFWDNIPILSFLFLGAKCRLCRQPISWRYPMVELTCAALWVALYHRIANELGVSWVDFVAHALFAAVLLALVFIDLDHFLAPDELNWVGIALGVTRDIVVVALALTFARIDFPILMQPYLYFGWLPRSFAGAIVYGGALFLVSWLGFAYYAREENESFGAAAMRYFRYLKEDDSDQIAPTSAGMAVMGPAGGELEEPEGDAPRLAFSPAFLALICALLMLAVVPVVAPLFFIVPLVLFTLISKRSGETLGQAAGRFFRSDDLGLPASASEEVAQSQAEADAFAVESESGAHGGMGLGDVKLALAIGAVLGPGQALLSLFFAAAIGAITGITMARIHGKTLRLALPFVPFMAAGAFIVMLFGPAMVTWYGKQLRPEQVQPTPDPFPPGSRFRNARPQPR